MPVPDGCECLVLNADYFPLNIITWQKSIKRMFVRTVCDNCGGKGRIKFGSYNKQCVYCDGRGRIPPATPVVYYDFFALDSAHRQHPIPAVMSNKTHIRINKRKVQFSKRNVLMRDNFTCQYCLRQFSSHELTLDHVVPRSMWKGTDSPTDFHNVVASCRKCNEYKRDRTPEQAGMTLHKSINGSIVQYKIPKHPSYTDLLFCYGKKIPQEWEPYIQRNKK